MCPFTLNFQELIVFALNVYIGLIYAFSTSGLNPSQSLSSVSTSGESSCSAYPSSACSSARSSLCHPSSPTCIYVQEPRYNTNDEFKPEERMSVVIVSALSLLVQMDIAHECALDHAHYWFKPVQHHRITAICEYPYTFPYPPTRD